MYPNHTFSTLLFRDKYRYGFCVKQGEVRAVSFTIPTHSGIGQERETQLNHSITSAEYWMYDGRLGRRWNVDPVDQVSMSNYSVLGDNPIHFNDPRGDSYYQNEEGQTFYDECETADEICRYGTSFKNIGEFQISQIESQGKSTLYKYEFQGNTAFTFEVITDYVTLAGGTLKIFAKDGITRLYNYTRPFNYKFSKIGKNGYTAAQYAWERYNAMNYTRSQLSPLGKFISNSAKSESKALQITQEVASGLRKAGRPNGFVDKFAKASPALKIGANIIAVANVGLNVVGTYNYYNNPNAMIVVTPAQCIETIVTTAVIYYGGIYGLVAVGIYYGGKWIYQSLQDYEPKEDQVFGGEVGEAAFMSGM